MKHVRTPFAPVRLVWGALTFGLSLLAVFQAPTFRLWQAAVVVTEWGHMLAGLALLPLLPGWRRSRTGRVGVALGLGAAVLALSPLVRALPVAQALPTRLETAFGPPARPVDQPAPLVTADILRGLPRTAVPPQSMVYSRTGGEALRLDFYSAQNTTTPAPCVIIIHGGSWNGGDSSQFAAFNHYLAGQGYAVASINYRLVPEWLFPAARDDLLAAIAFLKDQAADLNIDPERLALLGRSAGGQLALLVAYTTADPAIRGVVSFYAPTDLAYGYANPANPRVLDSRVVLAAYLGGSPDQVAATYAAASPIEFVGPATPPTLLIHGDRDELVTVEQSTRLQERLAVADRPHLLLRLPWATHGADFNLDGASGQISTYAILHFLEAVVR